MKKDSEKEETKKQRMNKFKLPEADEADKTILEKMKSFFSKIIEKKKEKRSDEPQKTILEKLKSIFCCCTRKKIKENPSLKKKKERSMSLKISTSTDEQSDKPQKTMLEKLKSFFSCCKTEKIKDNPRLKKFNYGIKRSKNDIKRLNKSLGCYIKQKLKLVTSLIIIYIIIFGAIVSIPITVIHLSQNGGNETTQERF